MRTKGTIIHQLDPEALGNIIAQKLGKPNAKPTYDYAIGVSTSGVALICSEGVGDFIASEAEVSAIIETPTDKGYNLQWADVSLTMEELQTIPTTKVDLADFVRVFGARLESNFSIWKTALV